MIGCVLGKAFQIITNWCHSCAGSFFNFSIESSILWSWQVSEGSQSLFQAHRMTSLALALHNPNSHPISVRARHLTHMPTLTRNSRWWFHLRSFQLGTTCPSCRIHLYSLWRTLECQHRNPTSQTNQRLFELGVMRHLIRIPVVVILSY